MVVFMSEPAPDCEAGSERYPWEKSWQRGNIRPPVTPPHRDVAALVSKVARFAGLACARGGSACFLCKHADIPII